MKRHYIENKALMGCLGIIFLLVWQFNSIRRAAIIMLTMPLVLVATSTRG